MTTTAAPNIRARRERLDKLQRADKWYLACGDGILWAPAFPAWLHTPGFWDEAHVFYHPFAPLFTVALIDDHGREIPLRQTARRWTPGKLECTYECEAGTLHETRTALPGGRFRSEWTLAKPDADTLRGCSLVAFTAQPSEQIQAADRAHNGVRLERTLTDRREQAMLVDATLTAAADDNAPARVAAVRSEGSAVQPHWRLTPFAERWGAPDSASPGLREELRLQGIHDRGLVYAAVAVQAGNAAFEMRITPRDDACTPKQAQTVDAFAASFGRFECDDPHLDRYYDYRLFGLHLCRLEGGAGNVRHACVAEGISYFHVPITYSAQCHMLECRWSDDPSTARGSLLNFLDHQNDDGSIHGRIYTAHLIGTDFYHANWGDAVLAVDALHPSDNYLESIYERLGKYCGWLDTDRDKDASGMIDVVNHYETGQEYMSRYQAVNPKADLDGWKCDTRLKAIDATVYSYQLRRALAAIATRLGRAAEADAWNERASAVGHAITERMYDPDAGLFSDIDPRTGNRTGVRAAVCFYPMLTDLLTDQHVGRLLDHLTNTAEFWTPWPVPSSALTDEHFNADAEWKGKRHVCPWNGRMWPMTNSHVVEGLIRQYRQRDDNSPARARCGPIAADLLSKYIRCMFHDRDVNRPNCFEHYNPITGHACEYRGIDDYQHSWVNDLIVRGVIGLDVETNPAKPGATLVLDPLPMNTSASITEQHVRGKRVAAGRDEHNAWLEIDGERHETTVGTPLRIKIA